MKKIILLFFSFGRAAGINSYLTSLVMVLALLLPTALFAQTAYLDEKGSLKTLEESATAITSSMTTWNAGWYVVSDNVTIDERITVNGDVHLILADGATLNANKGIGVSSSATFNVYAQSENEATMGKLIATAESRYNAGIGGSKDSKAGEITINGGNITAIGYDGAGIGSGYKGTVGTITINDGVIDAKDNYYGAGYGAGIGGGRYGSASVIDIKGGVIQAKGIGMATTSYGNPTCGNINIYDGVKRIIVTSKDDGKGLASSSAVTFYSGSSAVEGDEKDAVFYDVEKGGGREIRSIAKNHLVTIADVAKASVGSVAYAYAGELVTLTLGTAANESSLTVSDGTNNLELTGAGDGKYTFVMPEGDVTVTADVLQTYSISLPTDMKIIGSSIAADGNGTYMTGTKVEFKPSFPYSASNVSDGVNTLTATDGVYSVVVDGSDITITADVQRDEIIDLTRAPGAFAAINGDVLSGSTSYMVHIADGATITLSGAIINGGIVCDGSATIILERENTVKGATNMAGIQVGGEGTTLTIKGNGSLTATGYSQSAGIGLSRAWNLDYDVVGGDVVIEGGNITAQGGSYGAGIGTGILQGSGRKVTLGNITIKGGTVKAIDGKAPNGDKVANGIGTGDAYPGCTNEVGEITIYDDIVVVDASSISKDVTYMHDNTDVSASKNDYFTIIENGERKIIYTGNPISDVEAQTYTGEAITPKPTVSLGSLNFTEGTDYEYSYTNNINVGSSATVTVTFKGDYAEFGSVSKSFNITKATPTVISPTSANPKYAGTCVALVTAGSTNFGTMLYSLDDDDDYSENIPCADKGGDYTVYYKVEESDNWSGAAGSVEIQVPVRVDVTVVGDGSVNGYDPDEFYPVGTVLTLTAEPDEDYRFNGWDDDFDAPAERVWTVLADAKDNELTVNFQQKTVCYGAVCVYNDGINEVEATIDGDSNIPWSISDEIRVQKVNLNRGFARQGYSTIILPFGFEEIEVDEAEFYELDGVSFANDKWNVSVTPVSEIRPNTPYLIHVMKNNVSFSGDIALRPIDDDVDYSVTKNGWELCGTYEYKVWNEGDPELGRVFIFDEAGNLKKIEAGDRVKPLQAYIRYVGTTPLSCSITGIHNFSEEIVNDNTKKSDATCTEKAKYYKSCVCGAISTSEVFEYGEPLGHSWGEYTLDGDQTCTDDGHKTARCTRVGCTETHTIEATGDALGTAYGALGVYNDYSKAIIDGTSETSVLLPWDIEVAAVELNRTFTAGTFSTITLPFSMSVENVEGAVFYKFMYVSSDDGTVHIEPVRDELIANTPYLVKTTGETISFKAGTTLKRTLDATPMDKGQDEGDGWELRGNYGKMVWREGHPDLGHIYYIDDAGKLKKIEADDELGPMQAYIYFNGDISDIPCSVTGNHDFSEEIVNENTKKSDATCTEKAKYYKSCIVCGTVSSSEDDVFEVGEPLGHSFTEYVSDNNATCEEDGTKTAVCDHGCGSGNTIADEGSKLGHDWGTDGLCHHTGCTDYNEAYDESKMKINNFQTGTDLLLTLEAGVWVCHDPITIEDGVAFNSPVDFVADKVVYSRLATKDTMSIILPFDVPADRLNGVAYKFTSFDGKDLFFESTDGIQANTPCMLSGIKTLGEPVITAELANVTIKASNPIDVEDATGKSAHFGVYEKSLFECGGHDYYGFKNNQFVKAGIDIEVSPFRAAVRLTKSALRSLSYNPATLGIVFDGNEVTHAADIEQTMTGKVNVHDVTGRILRQNVEAANCTDGLEPGVYVVNGKKVVVTVKE